MDERLLSDIADQAQQKVEALGMSAIIADELNKKASRIPIGRKEVLSKAVPLGKFAGGMGLALSAVDAVDAAINADKIYGSNPTLAERYAAAAGSAANSASFGVVPADKAALGLVPRKYMTKEELEKLPLEVIPRIQK